MEGYTQYQYVVYHLLWISWFSPGGTAPLSSRPLLLFPQTLFATRATFGRSLSVILLACPFSL